MKKLALLLCALLLLTLPFGSAITRPAGVGVGETNAYCDSMYGYSALVDVALTRPGSTGYDWDVRIIVTIPDCLVEVHHVTHCQGTGRLAEGLTLDGCSAWGSGNIGPLEVCGPNATVASTLGHISYTSFRVRVVGDLTFVLTGEALEEANTCP